MNDAQRSERNRQMLEQVDPWHQDSFRTLIDKMEAAGWKIRAQEAYRTNERQAELFAKKLTKIRRGGKHNRHRLVVSRFVYVPASLAIDFVEEDNPLTSLHEYIDPSWGFVASLAIFANRCGLQTGCLWGLTGSTAAIRSACIEKGDWMNLSALLSHPRGCGWDPLHVEVP